MMRALIAGGTGFIGSALTEFWLAQNHDIVILGRDAEKIKQKFSERVTALTWEQFDKNPTGALEACDVVINLCGSKAGRKRWSAKHKQELIDSRVIPTRKIATACAALGTNAPKIFNANGCAAYGIQQSSAVALPDPVDEASPLPTPPQDFFAELAKQWQQALEPASTANIPVVLLRFGIVFANSGGALPMMAMPFHFFIGGPVGSGRQAISWIALEDLLAAIDFLVADKDSNGIYNLVAPKAVTQREFAHSLGHALHRPSFMPTPAWLIKLVFGEMGDDLLLNGIHVIPTRLLEMGFHFQYPDLDSTLAHIYNK